MSATPLIEPIVPAHEAVVNAPAHEPEKPVALPHSNAFGVPLPVHPKRTTSRRSRKIICGESRKLSNWVIL